MVQVSQLGFLAEQMEVDYGPDGEVVEHSSRIGFLTFRELHQGMTHASD
jgi:hypothetical protein